MSRSEFHLPLIINERFISVVIIDQHYKCSHPEISDKLILNLLSSLNGTIHEPEAETENYQYFKVEPLFYFGRPFRLVFLLPKQDDFIGVINAFRVKGKKYET